MDVLMENLRGEAPLASASIESGARKRMWLKFEGGKVTYMVGATGKINMEFEAAEAALKVYNLIDLEVC